MPRDTEEKCPILSPEVEVYLPPPRHGVSSGHTSEKMSVGSYIQRNTYYLAQSLYTAIRRRGFDSAIRKQADGTFHVYKLPKGFKKKGIPDASAP